MKKRAERQPLERFLKLDISTQVRAITELRQLSGHSPRRGAAPIGHWRRVRHDVERSHRDLTGRRVQHRTTGLSAHVSGPCFHFRRCAI